ncbi:MAG: putative ABC exporter domain-containing protein [Christensenellales bacterium]
MNALVFILRKTLINYVKELFRRKTSILMIIVFAALAVSMLSSSSTLEMDSIRNLDVFGAFLVGIYLLIFSMTIYQGLKKGTALFSMADVNLLFTSPVNPRKTLIYGVARQTAILMLASVFLFFQYSNLKVNFGVGASGLTGLMISYLLMTVCTTFLSVNIYSLCASKPHLRGRIELAIRLTFVALIVGIIIYAMVKGSDVLNSLRGFMGSDLWNHVPVIGWARALTIYASEGDWLKASFYILLLLLGCGACLLWLAKSSSDYYEDVLSAAENAQQAKAAAASGKFYANSSVSKRAKRELPPLGGKGAFVFFSRIMREEKRRGFWLFSLTTISAVGSPLFGLMMQSMGESANIMLWAVLMFGAYMLIFLSLTSSVNRELTQHYIFIAPSSAFMKLVAISFPQVIKYAVDSAVFFVTILLVLKTNLLETALAAITYFSIGLVFTSGQLLVEKLLHNIRLKALIIMLYILMLILLVVPGIVAGMSISSLGFEALGFLAAIVWNVLVSSITVLACRNLLHSMG